MPQLGGVTHCRRTQHISGVGTVAGAQAMGRAASDAAAAVEKFRPGFGRMEKFVKKLREEKKG